MAAGRDPASPIRRVVASAPIRICDNGGWTDTWFARRGRVFNIAAGPRVAVHLELIADEAAAPHPDVRPATDAPSRPAATPLIDAAIASVALPAGTRAVVDVRSEVPPGASTGTSASLTVALLGALDAAVGRTRSPGEVARAAHEIETARLGQEAGVQDQICAAHGGISFIEIDAYPRAHRTSIDASAAFLTSLERALCLVYLGRSHVSSDVHRQVIAGLGRHASERALDDLRAAAGAARDAVAGGSLDALGRAMQSNTEAQDALHPALIGAQARRVIDAARSLGARGWKVNGAGGDGGSVTLLAGPREPAAASAGGASGSEAAGAALGAAIERAVPGTRVIPVTLERHGLVVRAHRFT